MTDQHPLIPVQTELNQIIDEIFGKIDASTAPHIRSLKEAAVEVIIRHPHSSEMILWLTLHIFIDFGQLCSSKPTTHVHGNRTAVFMISTTCFEAGQHT